MPSRTEFLTLDEVLAIHELVLPVGDGEPGVRDLGLLESAVYRPQTGYYSDLAEMAAALMESLLINHPFIDGNKRTAFIATDTFLRLNGYAMKVDALPAYDRIIASIADPDQRFGLLATWVRDSVQPL